MTSPLYDVVSAKIGDKKLPKGVEVQWECSGLSLKTKLARFVPIDTNNSVFQITFLIKAKQV
jgi:hypothetical protein